MLNLMVQRLVWLGVSVLVIAGCERVGLEIETVIHDDGSFDRTVTYTVEDVDRETLSREYALPAGASWAVTETTKAGDVAFGTFRPRLFVYQAKGTFRALETDYGKQDSRTPPAWSRNRIRIDATPDAYRYQETFSDTTDTGELQRLGERFVQSQVKDTIAHIRETVLDQENDLLIDAIQRHVTVSSLGYLDQVWHLLETVNSSEERKAIETLVEQSESFLIGQIDQWWRAEGLHYPRGERVRDRITEALKQAAEPHEERPTAQDEWDEALKRYGGAYLPSWKKRSYRLKVTVTMPRDITTSNATEVHGNTAVWEFDPLYFLLKDYMLEAESVSAGSP